MFQQDKNIRNIRGYALAATPFIAFFAYQVLVALPRRPEVADPVHGFTVPLGLDDGRMTRYISTLDCVLTFGPFLIAFVIVAIGLWRSGAFTPKNTR
ncbi:hypothetical protein [Asticcacaulis solisilvae]|uniref:hypothetical protein n=1 Tax=Asticcacaulis solisilvae TaxID=1217274 RepID=UPI003FD87682